MIEEIKEIDYLKNMIFISFDEENCINLKKLCPENDVQLLIFKEGVTEKLIKTLRDNNLNLDIYYKNLTKENVKLLHKNGIEVKCWTCDNKDDDEMLVSFGVDYITTNILE